MCETIAGALHAPADHLAFEHVEGGEQRSGAPSRALPTTSIKAHLFGRRGAVPSLMHLT
jgi:hypothetical protein